MNYNIRNHPWPIETNHCKTPETTAIVSVNYNTKELITQLIWSIYKNPGITGFAKLIIVDNHSIDGSLEILRALDNADLIELIENSQNIYHGPALNQALDFLAVGQQGNTCQKINAVWIIDSDCMVLRPDTLENSTQVMTESKAAIVGQPVHDKWSKGSFGLHSLLIDPWKVWRNLINPFEEHGEPSKHLQESCVEQGLVLTSFDFIKDRYIIHLGRGTLAEIKKNNDETNRYFDWAKSHFHPHYAGEEGIEVSYNLLKASFYVDVPDFEPLTVVNAIKTVAKSRP
jgi:glycosyltransferase involved in cell wall biosynthesis